MHIWETNWTGAYGRQTGKDSERKVGKWKLGKGRKVEGKFGKN